MWVTKTLLFSGTCSARSEVTLVSKRIVRPFRTVRFAMRFPAGCLNLMSLRVFTSEDSAAPTTGLPSGIDLFQDLGQTSSMRGEATQLFIHHTVSQPAGGSYLKIYANNTDFFDHAVDVELEIQTEEPDPPAAEAA